MKKMLSCFVRNVFEAVCCVVGHVGNILFKNTDVFNWLGGNRVTCCILVQRRCCLSAFET